jgi:hypothetical protein
MGSESAAMVFAVCIKSVQGRGQIKHGDFAMASGERFASFNEPRHSLDQVFQIEGGLACA